MGTKNNQKVLSLRISGQIITLLRVMENQKVGVVIRLAIDYLEGKSITIDDTTEGAVLQLLIQDIERQKGIAEIHRNCGKLGGRPKPNITKNNQMGTKRLDLVSETPKRDLSSLSISSLELDKGSIVDDGRIEVEKVEEKKKSGSTRGKLNTDFIEDKEHRELFESWIEYRRQLKKPYKTQRGIETAYKQLVALGNGTIEGMRKVVAQSVSAEYQGLFQVKDNGKDNRHSGTDSVSERDGREREYISTI